MIDAPDEATRLFAASPTWGWPTRLWLALVAVCVLWQPFELGFYMDDWVTAAEASRHGASFSLERFAYNRSIDTSRPAMGVLRFITSSLLSDRPFLWHLGLLIANAATALAIARIAALTASRLPSAGVSTAFLVCATSWVVLPWTAAARYWPVVLPVAILLAVFGWLVAWVLKAWMGGRAPMVVPALVYLYACLSYEAFYFQYLALIIVGIGLWMAGRTQLRLIVKTALALSVVQIVALGWYIASKTLTDMQKPVIGNWREELLRNMLRLLPEMAHADLEGIAFLTLGFLGLIALSIYVLMRTKEKMESSIGLVPLAVSIGGCVVAAFISICVFTLGGRVTLGTGVESRSLTFFSFWMLVAISMLVGSAFAVAGPRQKQTMSVCGALCCFALLIGGLARGDEWVRAWRLQQKILAEAPLDQMAAAEPGAEVLLVAPSDLNGAPAFFAPWDINTAIPITHPAAAHLKFVVYSRWMGAMAGSGSKLSYQNLTVFEGKTIYVWRPQSHQFYKAEEPFVVHQDLTITPN